MSRVAVSVLLLASALALVLTLPPQTFRQAEAQTFSRSIVTVYQTVYVPVYTTIFRTLTYTAYSTSYSLTYSAYTTTYPVTYYSLTTSSVTQWNNITWTLVTTHVGLFGSWPIATFGAYSDLALVAAGVLGGVAVGLAFLSKEQGEKKEVEKAIEAIMKKLQEAIEAIMRMLDTSTKQNEALTDS